MLDNNSTIQVKNKIIILHVLKSFGVPLTNEQLTQFILENNLLNYFELQQYLNELSTSEMIERKKTNEDNLFYLTNKGKQTLNYFKDRLSKNLRRSINDKADQKKERIITKTEIFADYHKIETGEYLVELKVIENHEDLMSLKLMIVSNEHAKKICEKWEKQAPMLYGDILGLLVSE